MKTTVVATISAFLAAASAQGVTFNNATGGFTCSPGGGAYCAATGIIIRCDGMVGQPGNCNDNLSGYPPQGGFANCTQSSPTAGDARCCKGDYCEQPIPLDSPTMGSNMTVLPTMTSSAPYSNGTTVTVGATVYTTVTTCPIGQTITDSMSSTIVLTTPSVITTVVTSTPIETTGMSSTILPVTGSTSVVTGTVSSTVTLPGGVSTATASDEEGTSTMPMSMETSASAISSAAESAVMSMTSAMTSAMTAAATSGLVSQITDGQIQASSAGAPPATTSVAPYTGAAADNKVAGGIVGVVAMGLGALLI